MAKVDLHEMEKRIQEFWDREQIFKTKGLSDEDIYSIDTPPPNISGKMHIGHAFSYSQQDFVVRFMRMLKGNVFYPFGTDDNGLPTERMIEKAKKIKSVDMDREEFVRACQDFLKEYTPEAVQDWKDLGISCDFEQIYSTISPQAQKVSQQSFIELYRKGHIYKKSFATLWCPHCQTAIAQAELEDKESQTKFSTLKFSCEEKDLLIATTRPEMLAACVAVFVNPKDERYKDIIGKKAKVPLFGQEVPVIADETALIDKGTGALMVCSYGDKFDAEGIARHNLDPTIIMEKNGVMNANAGVYEGLYVTKARAKILEDLEEAGLIVEQSQVDHVVNVHDKCGTPIEFINTPQWFTRVIDKKKELLAQGAKVKWYPEYMKKRYDNWVEGLDWDWSLSRNRHFGVPIPAWECEECQEIILADESELPVDPLSVEKICSKCSKKAAPESMVLDTWATSSLTPQIASNLFEDQVKIPYAIRAQAHDIIRTWAFYTIVKSYLSAGEIPWKEIIVSGNVSMGGEKMSKSKGNVVDPKKVMSEYSADALRYWAAGSKLGADLDYNDKDLKTGKKLVNKILNAANFVFMNLEGYDRRDRPEKLEEIDQIFLTKLGLAVERATEAFSRYEYSKAKQEIDSFFWQVFTDNYLEIVKKRVYQGEGDKKLSAQYALYQGLLVMLKLWAPIVPFVTEEVYQKHYRDIEGDVSIHVSGWPKDVWTERIEKTVVEQYEDGELGVGKWTILTNIIAKVRQEKSSAKKSMNSEVRLTLCKETIRQLEGMLDDLKNVTGSVEVVEGKQFGVELI